jgi:hypothetical protein
MFSSMHATLRQSFPFKYIVSYAMLFFGFDFFALSLPSPSSVRVNTLRNMYYILAL